MNNDIFIVGTNEDGTCIEVSQLVNKGFTRSHPVPLPRPGDAFYVRNYAISSPEVDVDIFPYLVIEMTAIADRAFLTIDPPLLLAIDPPLACDVDYGFRIIFDKPPQRSTP